VDLTLPNDLLQQARTQCDALLAAERQIADDLTALCWRTWEFGKSLVELKEIIGHGKWSFFVAHNFPSLPGNEESRCRRAREAMEFFRENEALDPKRPDSAVFTIESIRKCVFRLAPEKDRPQIPGDEPIKPHAHPLTFVNQLFKWDRQAELGLIQRPPLEIMQRDLEPAAKRIVELCGREWLLRILG